MLHAVDGLVSGFIKELQAQRTKTSAQELGQDLGCRLGFAVKQGVATAKIGP